MGEQEHRIAVVAAAHCSCSCTIAVIVGESDAARRRAPRARQAFFVRKDVRAEKEGASAGAGGGHGRVLHRGALQHSKDPLVSGFRVDLGSDMKGSLAKLIGGLGFFFCHPCGLLLVPARKRAAHGKKKT